MCRIDKGGMEVEYIGKEWLTARESLQCSRIRKIIRHHKGRNTLSHGENNTGESRKAGC